MARTIILLFMLFVISISTLQVKGEETDPISQDEDIVLDIKDDNIKTKPKRAPIRICLHACYDKIAGIIAVSYKGEAEGEVSLFLNGELIATSYDLNATFHVSEAGLYTLIIQTDRWVAEGYLQL